MILSVIDWCDNVEDCFALLTHAGERSALPTDAGDRCALPAYTRVEIYVGRKSPQDDLWQGEHRSPDDNLNKKFRKKK